MPQMNWVSRVLGDLFQFLIKLVPRLNSISLYFSYTWQEKGVFFSRSNYCKYKWLSTQAVY